MYPILVRGKIWHQINVLGYKFQASGIIVNILTPIGTKSHTTSNTGVIGRETTDSTKVATGG